MLFKRESIKKKGREYYRKITRQKIEVLNKLEQTRELLDKVKNTQRHCFVHVKIQHALVKPVILWGKNSEGKVERGNELNEFDDDNIR